MKNILKYAINTIHIFSFLVTMLVGVAGILYEIVGRVKFEQLMDKLHITNGVKSTWVVGSIMLFLLIITAFIKDKLK